ncbi:MAG: hypothetical protein ACK2U9_15475, partial [Anaerolineae bacterium]
MAVKPTESMDTGFSEENYGASPEPAQAGPRDSVGGGKAVDRRSPAGPSLNDPGGAAAGKRAPVFNDDNLGRVLGSYRLLSLLGEGGMGR